MKPPSHSHGWPVLPRPERPGGGGACARAPCPRGLQGCPQAPAASSYDRASAGWPQPKVTAAAVAAVSPGYLQGGAALMRLPAPAPAPAASSCDPAAAGWPQPKVMAAPLAAVTSGCCHAGVMFIRLPAPALAPAAAASSWEPVAAAMHAHQWPCATQTQQGQNGRTEGQAAAATAAQGPASAGPSGPLGAAAMHAHHQPCAQKSQQKQNGRIVATAVPGGCP